MTWNSFSSCHFFCLLSTQSISPFRGFSNPAGAPCLGVGMVVKSGVVDHLPQAATTPVSTAASATGGGPDGPPLPTGCLLLLLLASLTPPPFAILLGKGCLSQWGSTETEVLSRFWALPMSGNKAWRLAEKFYAASRSSMPPPEGTEQGPSTASSQAPSGGCSHSTQQLWSVGCWVAGTNISIRLLHIGDR